MKRSIPTFETDEAAERFVATADLSEYDLSGGTLVQFEFAPDDKVVNLRMPGALLDAVRGRAAREGMSDQAYICMAIERELQNS